jgi:ligand-binding SRPBCC domain-containing protein
VNESYVLERKQWVASPRERVFEFFSDARNLEALTPPWLNFAILPGGPAQIAAGAIIRYQLAWHGIPIRWKTEIARWEPPHEFEDVQISGPYRVWRHTHRFDAIRGGTDMTDVVRYSLPFGPLGRAVHAAVVRRNLEQIFDYRRDRIRALLDGTAL